MDRLNLSLDEIIASKNKPKRAQVNHSQKKNPKFQAQSSFQPAAVQRSSFQQPRQTSSRPPSAQRSQQPVLVSRKPFRATPPVKAAGPVVVSLPMQTQPPASAPVSIFDRLGTSSGQGLGAVSGTKITIAQLNHNITTADIAELCGSVGEVKQVEMKHDRQGRPLGVAEVLFARRSDATNAIKKFHGLALDGTPMAVTLTGENGKANPFNPLPLAEQVPNKRLGFFGTALAGDDELQEEEDGPGLGEDEEEVEVIYVDEYGNQIEGYEEEPEPVTGGRQVTQPRSGGRTSFAVTLNRVEPTARSHNGSSAHRGGPSRGRGAGAGGRGRGRGGRGRGRGGPRPASADISSVDLDAEMDRYMTKR